jgi:hypothetical protein
MEEDEKVGWQKEGNRGVIQGLHELGCCSLRNTHSHRQNVARFCHHLDNPGAWQSAQLLAVDGSDALSKVVTTMKVVTITV